MIISAAAELTSRFAPIPKELHIGFCLFATVVFLLIYWRRKTVSSLIWLLVCDSTAILQFYSDPVTAAAVGLCEIVLFVILICVSLQEWRERKRLEEAEAVTKDESEESTEYGSDNLEDIARLVKSERSKLAGNDDDIIKNAFDDN